MVNHRQTIEDWNILKNSVSPDKLKEFENASRLLSDNASCHQYNATMLKYFNQPIIKIKATNSRQYAKKANDDAFRVISLFMR